MFAAATAIDAKRYHVAVRGGVYGRLLMLRFADGQLQVRLNKRVSGIQCGKN
jgi:hypothetical protein